MKRFTGVTLFLLLWAGFPHTLAQADPSQVVNDLTAVRRDPVTGYQERQALACNGRGGQFWTTCVRGNAGGGFLEVGVVPGMGSVLDIFGVPYQGIEVRPSPSDKAVVRIAVGSASDLRSLLVEMSALGEAYLGRLPGFAGGNPSYASGRFRLEFYLPKKEVEERGEGLCGQLRSLALGIYPDAPQGTPLPPELPPGGGGGAPKPPIEIPSPDWLLPADSPQPANEEARASSLRIALYASPTLGNPGNATLVLALLSPQGAPRGFLLAFGKRAASGFDWRGAYGEPATGQVAEPLWRSVAYWRSLVCGF